MFTSALSKEVHYLTSTTLRISYSRQKDLSSMLKSCMLSAVKVFKDNQEIVDDQTPFVRLLDLLI